LPGAACWATLGRLTDDPQDEAMARKIPKDSSAADWAANRYVDASPDFSLVKTGFLNTALFLPISNDRRVCLELHKLYADWKYTDLFSSPQIIADLDNTVGRITDSIILTAPGNHWHFNIDGLANLSEAVFAACDRVFVDQSVSDDQISFLRTYTKTLGIEYLTFGYLEQPMYSLRNVRIPVNKPFASKVAAFRSCLGRMEDVAPHPDARKRLYVSRKGADTRQLLNEDELLSMLQSEFYFYPILNENYSLIEQLALYRNADIVMGPHGAGLTNILFADSPSLLIEMFSQVQQPFYQALAQALGIQYLGIPGAAALPDNDPYRADNAPFRVDVAKVRDALGKLLTE
jgi:hypothetical protein